MTVAVTRENENEIDFFQTLCLYCETLGQLIEDCRKKIRKEQRQNQDSTQTVKGPMPKIYSLCPDCQRANHPPDKRSNGPNAANTPQKYKQHTSTGGNTKSLPKNTSPQDAPPSKIKKTI